MTQSIKFPFNGVVWGKNVINSRNTNYKAAKRDMLLKVIMLLNVIKWVSPYGIKSSHNFIKFANPWFVQRLSDKKVWKLHLSKFAIIKLQQLLFFLIFLFKICSFKRIILYFNYKLTPSLYISFILPIRNVKFTKEDGPLKN